MWRPWQENPSNVSKRQKKTHACPVCNATFAWKGNMTRHVRQKHSGIRSTGHACPICNTTFGCKSGLYRHVQKVHLNVKYVTCTDCQTNFQTSRHFDQLDTILGFRCNVCKIISYFEQQREPQQTETHPLVPTDRVNYPNRDREHQKQHWKTGGHRKACGDICTRCVDPRCTRTR